MLSPFSNRSEEKLQAIEVGTIRDSFYSEQMASMMAFTPASEAMYNQHWESAG
jgi:hypothetical protein